MPLDAALVSRLLEPLAREPGELADVFVEQRRETVLVFRDGDVVESRVAATEGLAARWRRGAAERLVAVSRADESGLREAVRELTAAVGRDAPPIRSGERPSREDDAPASAERWGRRLAALFARHAPRHRFRWTLAEVRREIFPARGDAAASARNLLSLEGEFTAASRRRDESRRFTFHGPESDSLAEDLRVRLGDAAAARDAPVPFPEGTVDAVLASGSAAVLFHEILSHPLEAGAVSPLAGLAEARLAPADLEVRDDATRLDLFGGYEVDDEGVRPRAVKLLDAGRLAGRLTTRASAPGRGAETSNGHGRRAEAWDPPSPRGANVVVSPGGATREELLRRLNQGLWIEELDRGSIELASGSFRIHFPRARRVRRGRLADELGPGILAGEILGALKGIEAGVGRETHIYRGLGWCARSGQVVPVQGAAPDLLIRGLAARSDG